MATRCTCWRACAPTAATRGCGWPARATRRARPTSPSWRPRRAPCASPTSSRSPSPPTPSPAPTPRATWCCSSPASPRRSAAPCSRRARWGARWSAGTTAASASCCTPGSRRARCRRSTSNACARSRTTCSGIRPGHPLRCPTPCARCRTPRWPSMQNSSTDPADPMASGWRWAPAWVLAYVALWPAPGYAEAVLVLGALVALWKLVGSRFRGGTQLLSHQAWALTTVLFLAYWVPEFVSSFDAVDPGRALREAAVDLRYLPFLWLAASAVGDARGRRVTFGGLAAIVAIWTIDGLVQGLGGASPLFAAMDLVKQAATGQGLCTAQELATVDRLGGIFGPCNLKLGPVLASLSPFAL